VEFVVVGKAQPAGSKRAFVVNGHAVVTDANKNSKPWQAEVKAAAVEAMPSSDLLEGPLELVVLFYEPRPKGHYNSKGELNAQGQRNLWPAKKPDVTKLVRGVEDAMTGVVYRDDAQIVHQFAAKHFGEPARAEIRVSCLSLEELWTNSKSDENSTC
jgi:Holliday junction resolvase RusA-like endonuclease